MTTLSADQQNRALEVMREYLTAKVNTQGQTPAEAHAELDRKRTDLVDQQLKPLVEGYLAGRVALAEFKSQIDGVNKRNELWGFKGIKGQMFFNMVVNVASDESECDHELKAAIAVPTSEEIARSRIRTFQSYVRRIGDDFVSAGGGKQGRPKPRSIPFFLSYLWHIQDRTTWPVYYTNSVNTMVDLNLWQPKDDLAEDYIEFKHIHEVLTCEFTTASGRPFDLYGVEHVFWFKGGNPYGGAKPVDTGTAVAGEPEPEVAVEEPNQLTRLPDSYVPPIVAILPRIACNEPGLAAR